jgi:hypothetical protein
MAEIRTDTTLRWKRDEISASIRFYERQLPRARAYLADVNASIRIFEASGDTAGMARCVDTHRLFKRKEPIAMFKETLAAGPLTTRELAQHIMKAKGLDPADRVLAKGIAATLVHALRMQQQRGDDWLGEEDDRGKHIETAERYSTYLFRFSAAK